MQKLDSECDVNLPEKRSTKRDEENEGPHEDDSDDEDTTGDHDSSDDDSSDHSRDDDGDGDHDSSDSDSSDHSRDNDGAIPSRLVRRTFETTGAFKYGKSPFMTTQVHASISRLRLLSLQWNFSGDKSMSSFSGQ